MKRSIGVLHALALMAALTGSAFAGGDWNDKAVDWQPYAKGLATAKEQKRPVCLIFFTETCPHCLSYSRVFNSPRVVELSKQFVMIRLDRNKNVEISKQYAPDGEYIPRTYFLSAEGKLDPTIHALRQDYLYFYDEHEPSSILAGMEAALERPK